MAETRPSKEVTGGKDKLQHEERFAKAKTSRQESAEDISQKMANLKMKTLPDVVAKAEASVEAGGSTSSQPLLPAGSQQQPLCPQVNAGEVNALKVKPVVIPKDECDLTDSKQPEVTPATVPPRISPGPVDETDATPTNMPDHSDQIPVEAAGESVNSPIPRSKSEQMSATTFSPAGNVHKGDPENKNELILHELAGKLLTGCNLRGLAFNLQLTEVDVCNIQGSHQNDLQGQFYKVLLRHWAMSPMGQAYFTLISVLESLKQNNAASWLRQKANLPPLENVKEKEASLQGDKDSSTVSHDPPRNDREGTTGGRTPIEYYDIFIIQTKVNDDRSTTENENIDRVREICLRHSWKFKVQGDVLGDPVLKGIEGLLKQSTHLLLIITDSDCVRHEDNETSFAIEMAFQLAFNKKSLSGKIIPVRCCEKRKLPLSLQSLTGVHIGDKTFEEKLVKSIDTSQRTRRERENCD